MDSLVNGGAGGENQEEIRSESKSVHPAPLLLEELSEIP